MAKDTETLGYILEVVIDGKWMGYPICDLGWPEFIEDFARATSEKYMYDNTIEAFEDMIDLYTDTDHWFYNPSYMVETGKKIPGAEDLSIYLLPIIHNIDYGCATAKGVAIAQVHKKRRIN